MRAPAAFGAPRRRSRFPHPLGALRGALAVLVVLATLAGCGQLDDALSPGTDPGPTAPARLGLTAQLPAFSRGAAAVAGLRTQAYYVRGDDSRVPIGAAATTTIADVSTQQVPVSIELATCLADPLRKGATGSAAAECPVLIELTLLDGERVVDVQTVGPIALRAGVTTTLPGTVQLFEVGSVQVGPAEGPPPAAGGRLRLEMGGTAALTAAVRAVSGQLVTGRAVQWTTDAPGVVRVDPVTGLVTAVAPGRARVTATLGAQTGSLDLTVAPKPSPVVVTGGGRGSGRVVSSPAGIDCRVVAGQPQNACSFTFPGDAQVTLTATADSGTTFGGWGAACATTSAGACVVDASEARSVSATFTALRRLTVAVAGTGGGSVSGSAIACDLGTRGSCTSIFPEGTTVVLSAAASVPNVFVGWTGACAGTTGRQCSITLSGDASVGAQFSAPLAVSVVVSGSGGGSVGFSTDGGPPTTTCTLVRGSAPNGACGATFPYGTTVTLTATPNATSSFTGWTGRCTGTGPCQVRVEEVSEVGAVFTQRMVNVALTLRRAATGGAGSVTVPGNPTCTLSGTGSTTSPASIGCTVSVPAGEPVSFTATPGPGSNFTGWSGCSGTSASCTLTTLIDAAVTASFGPAPLVLTVQSVGSTGAGNVTSRPGTLSCTISGALSDGTCTNPIEVGATVTLTAAANANSTFGGWGGACAGTAGTTCTVTLAAAATVTVRFDLVTYGLQVNLAGAGSGSVRSSSGVNCPDVCSVNSIGGATVTLTATPAAGSSFGGWSGACSGTAPTCTVTMDAPRTVTASFSPVAATYPVTVATAGTGTGTVSSSPGGISCPGTCASSYAAGTTVTLTATPTNGSRFTGWGGACAGTGPCTLTVNAAVSVTATFTAPDPATFALTAGTTGTGDGTITSSPAGIACPGTCSAPYAAGTVVTLTATPGTSSAFGGWSGACSGTAPTCTVTMDAARSVTATFSGVVPTYALSVALAGTGTGTVASAPSGISCPTTCAASYSAGTQVTLTAAPTNGSSFTGWSGACSGTGPCTVTMSAARAVTATFAAAPRPTFALTAATAGTGSGTITSNPSGIVCPESCVASYTSGTVVTLTATSSSNSTFGGWSGACSGTAPTCSVTMDAARSVTATFSAVVTTRTLTVSTAGTGSGTVGSTPGGISCPGSCVASYQDGTQVTLTAAPTNGSTFAGWSGACSGTGPCTVTMTAARSVTATFAAPASYTLTAATAGSGSGAVSSSPGPIDCPGLCSASYPAGTVVTLTATVSTGSSFGGWSGACSGTSLICTVTMNAARSVTATFLTTYRLSVGVVGSGSSVSGPGGLSCPGVCAVSYDDGASVLLTAQSGTGNTVTWDGACTGNSFTCTVSMTTTRSTTATFRSPLSVSITAQPGLPAGSGSVTSPVGISCSAASPACQASVIAGTSVTLTAQPSSGSFFTGWSGGGCSGTNPSCTIPVAQATSVSASFNRAPS